MRSGSSPDSRQPAIDLAAESAIEEVRHCRQRLFMGLKKFPLPNIYPTSEGLTTRSANSAAFDPLRRRDKWTWLVLASSEDIRANKGLKVCACKVIAML